MYVNITDLDYEKKATDAVDFSDIAEVADEEEEEKAKISQAMSFMHMLKQGLN